MWMQVDRRDCRRHTNYYTDSKTYKYFLYVSAAAGAVISFFFCFWLQEFTRPRKSMLPNLFELSSSSIREFISLCFYSPPSLLIELVSVIFLFCCCEWITIQSTVLNGKFELIKIIELIEIANWIIYWRLEEGGQVKLIKSPLNPQFKCALYESYWRKILQNNEFS